MATLKLHRRWVLGWGPPREATTDEFVEQERGRDVGPPEWLAGRGSAWRGRRGSHNAQSAHVSRRRRRSLGSWTRGPRALRQSRPTSGAASGPRSRLAGPRGGGTSASSLLPPTDPRGRPVNLSQLPATSYWPAEVTMTLEGEGSPRELEGGGVVQRGLEAESLGASARAPR